MKMSMNDFIKTYGGKRKDEGLIGSIVDYLYDEPIHVDENFPYLWTYCGEENCTFVISGFHFVNRLGYIFTKYAPNTQIDLVFD